MNVAHAAGALRQAMCGGRHQPDTPCTLAREPEGLRMGAARADFALFSAANAFAAAAAPRAPAPPDAVIDSEPDPDEP